MKYKNYGGFFFEYANIKINLMDCRSCASIRFTEKLLMKI